MWAILKKVKLHNILKVGTKERKKLSTLNRLKVCQEVMYQLKRRNVLSLVFIIKSTQKFSFLFYFNFSLFCQKKSFYVVTINTTYVEILIMITFLIRFFPHFLQK